MTTSQIPDGEERPEIVEGDGDIAGDRAAADRRRRTEAQRAKRLAARICGWCEVSADYCTIIMILWYSRTKSRRLRARHIAICEWCFELMSSDEDTPDGCRGRVEPGVVTLAAQEEGPLTEWQRRIEAQRVKRAAERICGWCRALADRRMVEWFVSKDTYQEVAICEECCRKLEIRPRRRNEQVNYS